MKKYNFCSFQMPILVASLVLWGASGAHAASITVASDTYISYYGQPYTSTFGQTFQTPDAINTTLQDFTFYIQNIGSSSISSKAYVYTWDGTKAMGSALFTSNSFTISAHPNDFAPYAISTGGVTLNAGQEYVMFFTLSNPEDFSASVGQSSWLLNTQNAYSVGSFVDNGNNFGQLTTTSWNNFAQYDFDLAFNANFTAPSASSTPLPAAAPAGFSLLAGLGLSTMLRRKKSAR